MNIRRPVLATATLLASISLLAGCTGAGGTGTPGSAGSSAATVNSSAPVTLGAVLPNEADPFWITVACGISKEAKASNATVTFKNAADTATQTLSANLDAIALTNPKGVIWAGSGNSTYNAKLQSIQQSGTPVVAVNNASSPAVEYADIVSSTDNAAFAKYVAGDIGNSGSVAILGGLQGFDILEARWKPLVAALKTAAPNVNVLSTQYDDFDRTKAASAASALMVAHPDLKAIYSISGPEGAGAASAVKQAGKTASVKVYTYDATPEVAQDLQNGTIAAALAQSALNQGRQAAKLAIEYARAGKTGAVQHDASKDVELPLKILTKDNVSSAASKDYIYSSTCS